MSTTYSMRINPVGSRSVAKAMGFETAYAVDAVGKRSEFQTLLIQKKTEWEAAHDSFVTDRTTLDNLMYSALHDAAGVGETLFDAACQGMLRYQYVIYCPVSVFIDIAGDNHRLTNLTYHRLCDATLWGLLQKFRPPEVKLVIMPFALLEHRKDFLRQLMEPRRPEGGNLQAVRNPEEV